jgi:hypothetical protein
MKINMEFLKIIYFSISDFEEFTLGIGHTTNAIDLYHSFLHGKINENK